jgi:hypothetical protein
MAKAQKTSWPSYSAMCKSPDYVTKLLCKNPYKGIVQTVFVASRASDGAVFKRSWPEWQLWFRTAEQAVKLMQRAGKKFRGDKK